MALHDLVFPLGLIFWQRLLSLEKILCCFISMGIIPHLSHHGRLGFCGEGWLAGSQCLPTHCFRSSAVFLKHFSPVLRIRIFSIPDSNFFHSGSEFFPSRIRINELKYFEPKIVAQPSENDLGCSSQIRIPDPDPQHCFSRKRVPGTW